MIGFPKKTTQFTFSTKGKDLLTRVSLPCLGACHERQEKFTRKYAQIKNGLRYPQKNDLKTLLISDQMRG